MQLALISLPAFRMLDRQTCLHDQLPAFIACTVAYCCILTAVPFLVVHCATVHADGTTEYDAHNLYGTTMAMRFHAAFTAITGKRPFILSRYAAQSAGHVCCL